jgi:hypothetical protein
VALEGDVNVDDVMHDRATAGPCPDSGLPIRGRADGTPSCLRP